MNMGQTHNNQARVSIVSCIYGVEDYIQRFLNSVLTQTYPNIDYVFVNDGTKDRSIEILENCVRTEYPDLCGRIQIINQSNKGLPFARHEGMKHISGEYFIFLDPDDWVEQDMIEKMVRKAVETAADCIYCDYVIESINHSLVKKELSPASFTNKESLVKGLYNLSDIHSYLWNKLFKTTVLKDLNLFVPPLSMMEDLVYSTQLIGNSTHVEKVDIPLYHYNKTNPGSVTRMNHKERRLRKGTNLFGLYSYFKNNDAPMLQTLWGALHFWIAWCMICSGNMSFFYMNPYFTNELCSCAFDRGCETRMYLIKRFLIRVISWHFSRISHKVCVNE